MEEVESKALSAFKEKTPSYFLVIDMWMTPDYNQNPLK